MNWIFLRGLTREQGHWGDALQVFESTNTNMKVFCLDLPGTGTERARNSPLTVSGIMEDLRSRFVFLREGVEGPWGLLGVSLGGMITLDWVTTYPEDFSHAVVINTSAKNLGLPHERIQIPALWTYIKESRKDFHSPEMEKSILEVTCNMIELHDVLPEWSYLAQARPISQKVAITQMLAGAAYTAPESLKVPTLVVACPKDRLVSSKCSERLAEKLALPIVRHPEGGHDLSTDDPLWLAEKVGSWVTTGQVPSA